MAIIDELLVGLGFDYDDRELSRFRRDIDNTTAIIKKFAVAATAAATTITGLVVASTSASDEQGKLADEIGDTVENLTALQFAAERSGGSAAGMATTLRDLSRRASEAARGVGEGVEAFGLLGVSATDSSGNIKPVSGLLVEVSGQLQGLNRARQIELADKLGIRDSVRLLQEGPQAIRAYIEEAQQIGVTTAEDAKISAEFQDSLTNLFLVIKQITRVFTRSLAPVLESLVESFVDWWKVNRELIEQNIPVFIEKATIAIKLLVLAFGAFLALRLAVHLIALIRLFQSLSLAILATQAAAFAFPILIAAGLALFAAFIQDAKVFFEGGDSFIGAMLEKWPQWTDEIEATAKALKFIIDAWEKFRQIDRDITARAVGIFTETDHRGDTNFLEKLTSSFSRLFTGPTLEDMDLLTNRVRSSVSGGTTIEKVDINVNGAGDPVAVSREVLNQLNQQTSNDLQTTVDQ